MVSFLPSTHSIFEKVSSDYSGKAKFAKLNVDDQPEIAARFGVLTIPLIRVFCTQRSIAEMAGLVPEVQLRTFIEQVIKETPACVANSSILVNAKISPPGSEQDVLMTSKVIAIVGLSKDPNKDSYSVAEYLKSRGYRIIPVNPTASEILGEKAYPSRLTSQKSSLELLTSSIFSGRRTRFLRS